MLRRSQRSILWGRGFLGGSEQNRSAPSIPKGNPSKPMGFLKGLRRGARTPQFWREIQLSRTAFERSEKGHSIPSDLGSVPGQSQRVLKGSEQGRLGASAPKENPSESKDCGRAWAGLLSRAARVPRSRREIPQGRRVLEVPEQSLPAPLSLKGCPSKSRSL